MEQGPKEGGESLQEGKMSLSPIDLNPCLLARSRPRVTFLINQGEKRGGGRGYVIQGSPRHRQNGDWTEREAELVPGLVFGLVLPVFSVRLLKMLNGRMDKCFPWELYKCP